MITIIAEIGINHSGNVEKALTMIREAAAAGADIVKFQSFSPENLYSSYFNSYMSGDSLAADNGIIDFFRQFELADEDVVRLKKCADDHNVEFLSAPFDALKLEFLLKLGMKKIKIASGSLNDIFLLKAAAASGRDIVASTGMSSEDEIAASVNILSSGTGKISLLHCVSVYPPKDDELNLKRMTALCERFKLPVGFSDHSKDSLASVCAASCGASIIEKHFMLQGDECPDAPVSLDQNEFRAMTEQIRRIEIMLGSGDIQPLERECQIGRSAKMSLVAARKIPAGTILSPEDLCAKRPGIGISPLDYPRIIGKKTVDDIRYDEIIDYKRLI